MEAISPDLALEIVLNHCTPMESRWLPLERAAGMILREPVLADRDLPPYDRVMMDGIGVCSSALKRGVRRFRIVGTQQAGIPAFKLEEATNCLEVMTGAVLPEGVDTILPVEWLKVEGNLAFLMEDREPVPGEFIHAKASDYPKDTELIAVGKPLSAPAIGVAASCGYDKIKVPRKLQLGLFSSGDEALPIDDEPGPYQIRQSNGIMLESLLRKAPIELEIHRMHLPDDFEVQKSMLNPLLPQLDVIVFSGGVSKGRFDFFKQLMEAWQAELHFDRVLQRPGQPLSFATREKQLIFGLPGNPNASLLGATRYLMPALWAMAGGQAPQAMMGRLSEFTSVRGPLVQWRPAKRISGCEDGVLRLEVLSPRNSGDLARLADAEGWVRLDPSDRLLPKGLSVPFYPW